MLHKITVYYTIQIDYCVLYNMYISCDCIRDEFLLLNSCDEYPELKGLATVVLVGLFVASVLLSRNNDIIYR